MIIICVFILAFNRLSDVYLSRLKYTMLHLKKIHIDRRHCAKSKSSSDFQINLPVNITLPSNTALYITDIKILVCWCTVDDWKK